MLFEWIKNFKMSSCLVLIRTLFKGYSKAMNIIIRTYWECWSQNIFSQIMRMFNEGHYFFLERPFHKYYFKNDLSKHLYNLQQNVELQNINSQLTEKKMSELWYKLEILMKKNWKWMYIKQSVYTKRVTELYKNVNRI